MTREETERHIRQAQISLITYFGKFERHQLMVRQLICRDLARDMY